MQLLRSNCETIQKPVKIVSGIVERNSTVPIVNNIMIDVKGTNAVFTTTDLDTQVVTSAPVGFRMNPKGASRSPRRSWAISSRRSRVPPRWS